MSEDNKATWRALYEALSKSYRLLQEDFTKQALEIITVERDLSSQAGQIASLEREAAKHRDDIDRALRGGVETIASSKKLADFTNGLEVRIAALEGAGIPQGRIGAAVDQAVKEQMVLFERDGHRETFRGTPIPQSLESIFRDAIHQAVAAGVQRGLDLGAGRA